MICGHIVWANRMTTDRLIFELGDSQECELKKLKQEGSFASAFHMDLQKGEHQAGVTIACTTKAWPGASLAASLSGSRVASVTREPLLE